MNNLLTHPWSTLKAGFRAFKETVFTQEQRHQHDDENAEKRRMDEELRFYQKEHPETNKERVLREAGGQDISAI